MSTVLVLGAGFSHAISKSVPLTSQLGLVVRQPDSDPHELAQIPEIRNGQDLERWLSSIAEHQPYLDSQYNAWNAAQFVVATRQIRAAILEGQGQAMTDPMPQWLPDLVRFLHKGGHTAITLNYDTLLESATIAVLRTVESFRTCLPAFEAERVRELPPIYVQSPGLSAGPRRIDTYRLIKLHGSLDAWWVPGDVSGETIGRVPTTTWGGAMAPESWDPHKTPAGKEPFIVPPASAKSAYYANPITRQLWRDAREQLLHGERVCVVGYSFPLTDLTIANLFADALVRQNADAAIEIVDVNPLPVQKNLVAVGIPARRITCTVVDPEVGLGPWVASLTKNIDLELYPPGP